ncbi:MAG: SMC-Scp complex subunit ScpB [Candidatus Aenigmatarchaeota archaeon]
MKRRNKRAMLEATLFMSNKPLTLKQISKILRIDEERAAELINQYKKELDSEEHGIRLIETAEGFQIRVKPDYAPTVRPLTPYQDLSRGLLRVLALVAYKQPITQSEIVKVIGNRTYEYVKQLVAKGLIKTEKFGRTKKLIATKEFAEYFGLESPEEAKKLFEKLTEEEKAEEGEKENETVQTDNG